MYLSIPLVWVHLGPSPIARHVRRSIRRHAILFKDNPLILLVDNEKNAQSMVLSNLKVIKVTIQSPDWNFIREHINHDLTFRNGFWFSSLARFKAISELMKSQDIERVLHIESDVVLMPNFPINSFNSIDGKIAYCLQGEGQGIAAILFVGSQEILDNLLMFCIEEVKRNPKSTDMTILFRYWIERPKNVLVLPSLTNHVQSQEGHKIIPKSLWENIDLFEGLFDPISVGQYLLGIDPRNTRGRRILFWQDDSHYVNVSKLGLTYEDGVLFSCQEGSKYPIFSLHVHSKDLRAFNNFSLSKLLKKRISQMNQGEVSEFLIWVWIKSGLEALKRRIYLKGIM